MATSTFCGKIGLFIILHLVLSCQANDNKFPSGFRFGVATSAYQVEGAWNVSDKSPSVWDEISHRVPPVVKNAESGDVACDSYHKWRTDVQMVKKLGVDFYRFSVSWSRLLPSGFPDRMSTSGAKYYNDLVDSLLAAGIKPVVTIHHFDLPQRLQDLGGWSNPLIADWFANYARVVFKLFGSRVTSYLTINEPLILCSLTYNMGVFPPNRPDPEFGYYLCVKNTLLAHAKAYRIYDKEFRAKQGGDVSVLGQLMWMESEAGESEETGALCREYMNALYMDPIYKKEGGWPKRIEKYIEEKSKKEGYSQSRLPTFTEEEKKLVQGTYDTISFNYYTSRVVRPLTIDDVIEELPMNSPEIGLFHHAPEEEGWWRTDSPMLPAHPAGFRKLLKWLKERYGNVPVQIMENGLATISGDLNDVTRVHYYKTHLEQLLKAIKEDGINVKAYAAWSLMDNFEWTNGYTEKFGLFHVDFTDPQRPRTPRLSAKYYARLVAARSLDVAVPNVRDEL